MYFDESDTYEESEPCPFCESAQTTTREWQGDGARGGWVTYICCAWQEMLQSGEPMEKVQIMFDATERFLAGIRTDHVDPTA